MTTTTPKYTLEWILPLVRASLRNREPYNEFRFSDYVQDLWLVFERVNVEGTKRKTPQMGTGDGVSFIVIETPPMIRLLVVEAFNYLRSTGIVAETINETNIHGLRAEKWPYFLTRRGADWADANKLMPEDSIKESHQATEGMD
jgi:hypothetical protein